MAAKRPKKIRATWDFRDPKSDRKLGPHGFQKSEKCQITQPRFGPPLRGGSYLQYPGIGIMKSSPTLTVHKFL